MDKVKLRFCDEFIRLSEREISNGNKIYISINELEKIITYLTEEINKLDEINRINILNILNNLKNNDIRLYNYLKGKIMSDSNMTYRRCDFRRPTPSVISRIMINDKIFTVIVGTKDSYILNLDKQITKELKEPVYLNQLVHHLEGKLSKENTDIEELKAINNQHQFNKQIRDILLKIIAINCSDKIKESNLSIKDFFRLFDIITINIDEETIKLEEEFNSVKDEHTNTFKLRYDIISRKTLGNCK